MKLKTCVWTLLLSLSAMAQMEPNVQEVPDSSASQITPSVAPVAQSAAPAASESLSKDSAAVAEPKVDEVRSAAIDSTVSSKNDSLVDSVKVAEKDSSSNSADTLSKTGNNGGLLGSLLPIEKGESIAKGHVFGGATLSLVQAETDDDAFNVIIGDIYKAEGYSFTVEAFLGYFAWNATAIGLRAGYSRSWYDIDFVILEDLLDLSERRKYVSNGFFVQPFLKNYMKVIDSKIIYFFNETSLLVEYSYGLSQSDDGEEISKSKNRMWTFKFGLNPGLCIMVLDRVAFETSVGLLGLSSSVIEVDDNGEKHSELSYNVVNFTINLLALDFSLVYFF